MELGRHVLLLIALCLQQATGKSCKRDHLAAGPCVDYISPVSGSLAGGQLVSIHGINLLPESPDPLVPASVVKIGGVTCDVKRVLSSSVKLVCKTRPAQYSASGEVMRSCSRIELGPRHRSRDALGNQRTA